MIKIILPPKIQSKLASALKEAGKREIGGVLMGEHIAENTFRVFDLSIQTQKGSAFYFLRRLPSAIKSLKAFFAHTDHNYKKYNYLGEWHSHPDFPVAPSKTDVSTMVDIIDDKTIGANFVVLIIVKLSNCSDLIASATVFFRGEVVPGDIVLEN